MPPLMKLVFRSPLLNLTHVAKTASSADQVTSLIDAPHAYTAWPANSVIGLTPEASRKRTREERWIDVPEETVEVVVGGLKLYGTSRRDIFNVVGHFIDYFHSGCIEAGAEAWC
jgi:hypothetical protein